MIFDACFGYFLYQQVVFQDGAKLLTAGLLALVTARGLACTGSFAKTTAQARHGAAKRAAETC